MEIATNNYSGSRRIDATRRGGGSNDDDSDAISERH